MNDYVLMLQSSVSLFLLVVVVFWLYRGYIVDAFRQDMFALRDELFDAAANGRIAFNSPHYQALRTTMHGTIRSVHRINLPFWLWMVYDAARHPEASEALPMNAVRKYDSDLTEEQRQLIDSTRERMHFLMVQHVVFSSPILMLTVVAPLALILVGTEKVLAIVKRLGGAGAFDRLDSAGLLDGDVCPA